VYGKTVSKFFSQFKDSDIEYSRTVANFLVQYEESSKVLDIKYIVIHFTTVGSHNCLRECNFVSSYLVQYNHLRGTT
jgi:hypothetical protein